MNAALPVGKPQTNAIEMKHWAKKRSNAAA